jgi:TonB-linked SusC/RagA family outer membrane protein
MPQTLFLRSKIPLAVLKLLTIFLFLPLFSLAQLKTISGTVTDDAGSPLADISVTVQGSTAGTKTDAKGQFSIGAALGAKVTFSATTHDPVTITVDERTDYAVSLKSKVSALTDVVVIGYGRQRKVNLVGAVSTVNVDEQITSRALPNVSSGLSGLVPGLSASQTSGMAGRNNAALLIRGLGTVNNSSPLIVVDGMPDVDINRINVNDIETISVLKDATSASVYGSRAANGVILITTRSGKGLKKTAINFNSNTSIVEPTKSFNFMADYPRSLTLAQRRAATSTLPSLQLFKNGTIDQWMALGMIDPLAYPNTDWWDIIQRTGTFQNYNVSAAGGSDKANFFASIGMKDEKGLQINNDYQQYNARFNFDYKIRDNVNTGIRFNGNWSKNVFALAEGFTDPDGNNTAGLDMQYAIAGITPYDPITGYYGGAMAYNEDAQAYNPYTVYQNTLTRQERQEANVSSYLDWSPIKGLTARVDYALNYYNQFQLNANTPNQAYNFQTKSFGSRVYVGPNAPIQNGTNTGYKTLMNARLTYHTVIARDHDITLLGVYSEEYWKDRTQFSSRNDRLYPTLTELDASLADIVSTTGNSNTEGLRSYIGRLNYNAYGKYLLEANFRVDGSSKFLDGHRFGFFPSVALGWRFTEESFVSKFTENWLSNGKIRVSYGGLGNNSGVGRFEQLPTLASSLYMVGGAAIRGFVNNKLVNQDLTWESTNVLNVGLELGFLNNRLTAELDYYDRLTTDMNRPSDLSVLLQGAFSPAPRRNIGDLRNRGVEATISWKDRVGGVNYGATINASYNKTRLEKWNEFLNRGTTFLNMPYHFVYTYVDKGIAQSWADVYGNTPQGIAPGDLIRTDLNGDGRITDADQKAMPNAQNDMPTTYFSFNGFASYKGFDVMVLLQGAAGRKDYWQNAFNNVNFGTTRYATTWEHWTNPWSWDNRNALWPRLGGSGNNNSANTSFWLDDLSYLRVKNIQIGYNIPGNLLKRIHVNNMRIAGSAENIATITSFRGLDPEKIGSNQNLYPINKSYSLVVQLGF